MVEGSNVLKIWLIGIICARSCGIKLAIWLNAVAEAYAFTVGGWMDHVVLRAKVFFNIKHLEPLEGIRKDIRRNGNLSC